MLLWMLGIGLLVALVSGAAHYIFAARLVKASVMSQMQTTLQASLGYLERTYAVPIAADLQVIDSSPAVDRLMMSFGDDLFVNRPVVERLFLSIAKSKAELYLSVRLIGSNATEKVIVKERRRFRKYQSILEGANNTDAIGPALASMFNRLESAQAGEVLFSGPMQVGERPFTFLAGVRKREPEIGGFGGAIIAHIDASDYLRYLTDMKFFDRPIAWVYHLDGRTILTPPSTDPTLDPRAYLFNGKPTPSRAPLASTLGRSGQGLQGLFHVAFSMPPDLYSEQLAGVSTITMTVLCAVALFSFLLALTAAGQIASPVRSLSGTVTAVSKGNLDVQVSEGWGGELGELARAFNNMVRSLERTTVSKEYVDNIIQSMIDTVIVVDERGIIQRSNLRSLQSPGV